MTHDFPFYPFRSIPLLLIMFLRLDRTIDEGDVADALKRHAKGERLCGGDRERLTWVVRYALESR